MDTVANILLGLAIRMATSFRPKLLQTSAITLVQFDRSGKLLAGASEDGTIFVWSLVSQRTVATCDLSAIANCINWERPRSTGTENLLIGLNNGCFIQFSFSLDISVRLHLSEHQ